MCLCVAGTQVQCPMGPEVRQILKQELCEANGDTLQPICMWECSTTQLHMYYLIFYYLMNNMLSFGPFLGKDTLLPVVESLPAPTPPSPPLSYH